MVTGKLVRNVWNRIDIGFDLEVRKLADCISCSDELRFQSKTGKFRYFFEVNNVVNFANSSKQYLVKTQYQQYALLVWD